jgi:xanthine dehydrogenase accessory factor
MSTQDLIRLPSDDERRIRAVDVPVRPVGYVRTDYREASDVPIQTAHNPDARGLLVVFDEFASGLADLAGFDYAFLLSYMDRAPDIADDCDEVLRPVPFLLQSSGQRRGVFATRYPIRPNRLTLSLVRVDQVDGSQVRFSGVDLLDRTPVVDVKPWVTGFDVPPGAALTDPVACGWYDELASEPVAASTPSPLGFVASTLIGRNAFVARTVQLSGFGASEATEIAIIDRHGVRAGGLLGGSLDEALTKAVIDTDDSTGASLLHVDVDTPSAAKAGLTCGGRATVVLQPLDHVPTRWWHARETRRPVALVTNLGRERCAGSVAVEAGDPDPPRRTAGVDEALDLLASNRSAAKLLSDDGDPLLVEAHFPVPRLIVVGTAELSHDIVTLGRSLGWDARHATEVDGALVDVAQLGPRDALVVLDHDVRSTGPVLAAALDGGTGYIGALGSRRTQARRVEHLRSLGLTDTQLDRLHGPTGLDLGATNRAETALSICAEIISRRTGRSARPLRETSGSITR